MVKQIHTADLQTQYLNLKEEIQFAMNEVLTKGDFINGSKVKSFEHQLASYLGVNHAVGCGNGTDALQIALMALNLNEGDEVIVPAFTYAATIEVIVLLKLTPVFADVDEASFNLSTESVQQVITSKSRAIMPVHLFGQASNMAEIMELAKEHNLFVIEDNAQSIGTSFIDEGGKKTKTGTIGHIGCASFFPTKNLGCYGDGGVLTTNDQKLAERIRMICNHGQSAKYQHEILGVNSRLDTLQAAVLEVKLRYLDEMNDKRRVLAKQYCKHLEAVRAIILPSEVSYSDHIYHQYTIRVNGGKRNELQQFLKDHGIHCVVYYPIPGHQQTAYKSYGVTTALRTSEQLSKEVLSLPVYPELAFEDQDYIIKKVIEYFNE